MAVRTRGSTNELDELTLRAADVEAADEVQHDRGSAALGHRAAG
ncbi:MAG TPA: hypothetical protein VIC58_00455 [Actinomycetota bacterium]